MAFAGIDPVALFRRHADRTSGKDVDPVILARVRAEAIPFLPATTIGFSAPLGRSIVDWPTLASAMAAAGATLEQDVDPTVASARPSMPCLLAQSGLRVIRLKVCGEHEPVGQLYG